MGMLLKSELLKGCDKQAINGSAYIKDCEKLTTKTGSEYYSGMLECKGSVPFKVWSSNPAFEVFKTTEIVGKVCMVEGKLDFFTGSVAIVIDNVCVDTLNGYDISDFYEDVYDIDKYFGNLVSTLSKNVSDRAMKVFDTIMTGSMLERFKVEYAARYHHDNCKSGLLAHTTKVVKLASLVKMYPAVMNRVGTDLLFLGCALHDIGKVYEYSNGSISDVGKLISHNTYGVLILHEYKDFIISTLGDEFYVNLLAIIQQHHGEYGERPRTVASCVINMLDCFDSDMTSLNNLLDEASEGEQIRFCDFKLI